MEWLGEIPEHWDVLKMRYLGRFSASGIDKYVRSHEPEVRIINFTDVCSNKTLTLNASIDYMVVTTNESNRLKNIVKKGDLIFLPSSETYEDLGVSALVDETLENTSFSYHVIRFEFQKEMIHSFRKYLTNNSSVLKQFSKAAKGTTRKIIGRGVFNNIHVLIPPISEQIAIANFLDDKCGKIDQAIAQKQKLIELLKERKQILIQNAVTGKVVWDGNAWTEPAEVKDSGVDWIGEIPEHWEIIRFKNLFTQSRLDPRKEDGTVTSYRDGEVTLRSNRRLTGYTEAILENGFQGIRKGQLVLNSMDAFEGAIGVSDSDGKCTPEYIVCDKMDCRTSNEYFAFLLREMALAKYIQVICNAVRQRAVRIRFNNLASRFVAVPPFQEQADIVRKITAESEKTKRGIAKLNAQIEKLKEYKASLINSAVTGKIKVC